MASQFIPGVQLVLETDISELPATIELIYKFDVGSLLKNALEIDGVTGSRSLGVASKIKLKDLDTCEGRVGTLLVS